MFERKRKGKHSTGYKHLIYSDGQHSEGLLSKQFEDMEPTLLLIHAL
jgi:hypothetical protein